MLITTIRPEQAKLKVVESDGTPFGFIEGYASVFGNTDLGGDIVEKGAFKKTLKERLPTGAIKLVDSHKIYVGTAAVIGVVDEAHEDDYGLWFKGRLSSVQNAQDVRTKVREKILDALSFGYDIIKDQVDNATGVRYLKELKLYEVSVVIWGMNPKAAISLVKGYVPVPNWPVAESVEFSAEKAIARIREWVNPAPIDEWQDEHWARFRKCFLYLEGEDYTNQEAYRLPFVEIINGAPAITLGSVKHVEDSLASEDSKLASEVEAKVKTLRQQVPLPAIEPPAVQVSVGDVVKAFRATASSLAASRLIRDIQASTKSHTPPEYVGMSAEAENCQGCSYYKNFGDVTGLCTGYQYIVNYKGYCSSWNAVA